jgi:hypothetical protein
MINNKIITIPILFTIILFITYHIIKKMILYRPISITGDKYQNFYSKLSNYLVSQNDLIENVSIRTPDDFSLDTLHVKNPNTDICIIYLHGNEGNLTMRYDMIKFLYNFGSVFIFDYRSYGKSTGSIADLSCEGLCNDAQYIWEYVTSTLNYHPNKVTLFGESLGCSIAIKLASDLSKTFNDNLYPNSLILNAPFSALSSIICHFLKKIGIILPESLLSLIETEYNSIEWIRYVSYATKIIIAHSPNDEMIPYSDAQKLYSAISSDHPNVKFINISGTHNRIGLTNNYVYSVSDILQE